MSNKRGDFPKNFAWFVVLLAVVVGLRIYDNYYKDNSSNKTATIGIEEDLDLSEVQKLYDTLREKYNGDLDTEELIEGAKRGLVEGTGDPYTVFLDEDEAQDFSDSLNGTFSGIGAELGIKDGNVIIVAPLDDFPAQKAGVQSGDIIVAVDGQTVIGESVEKVVSLIRGESGTDVTLTLRRGNSTNDTVITRAQIDVPTVRSEIKDGVGYLRISSFSEDTAQLTREAIEQLLQSNPKGILLDLRNNGGGFLDSAVDIAGYWLDGDVVVKQESSIQDDSEQKAKRGVLVPKDLPTQVLINSGSASASEILAGALRDNERAKIVGETSFGKGTVQQILELDEGLLKVTVAEWLTPDGEVINGQGLTPDIVIEFEESDDPDKDVQLEKALEQF